MESSNIIEKILALVFVVCAVVSVPTTASAIEIIIKNDLNPREQGSELEIDNAVSLEAPKTKVRFEVLPGEMKRITGGNVLSFVVIRKYPRHKLKYEISCPATEGEPTKVTPLDIHNQSLPGDCRVVRQGHWSKRSGMSWENLNKPHQRPNTGPTARGRFEMY
jgi:hypothetical protein